MVLCLNVGWAIEQVMSMSTALGLSSEFCGDEGGGLGRAFSVEVRSLSL